MNISRTTISILLSQVLMLPFAQATLRTFDGGCLEMLEHTFQLGELKHRWSGHYPRVTALNFSPDGKMLVTVGTDDLVRLWDNSLNNLGSQRLHSPFPRFVGFAANSIVTVGEAFVRTPTGVVLGNEPFRRQSISVGGAAVAGSMTAEGFLLRAVSLGHIEAVPSWDMGADRPNNAHSVTPLYDDVHEVMDQSGLRGIITIRSAPLVDPRINLIGQEIGIAEYETTNYLASASTGLNVVSVNSLYGNALVFFNWRNGSPAFARRVSLESRVGGLSFSSDGSRLAVVFPEKVMVLDANSLGTGTHFLHVEQALVSDIPLRFTAAAFSRDGNLLVVGDQLGFLKLIDLNRRTPPVTLAPFNAEFGAVEALVFNSSSTLLAVAFNRGAILAIPVERRE